MPKKKFKKKRKVSKSKGRNKGAAFERHICKLLSAWWSDGERDDIFWRSVTSGGRAKSRSKKGKMTYGQHGDIQATDPIGQPLIDLCSIELKRGYGNRSLFDLADPKPSSPEQEFLRWYLQASQDSESSASISWLLITCRNSKEEMVTMPWVLFTLLRQAGCRLQRARPFLKIRTKETGTLFCTKLSELLRLASCDNIVAAIRSHERK